MSAAFASSRHDMEHLIDQAIIEKYRVSNAARSDMLRPIRLQCSFFSYKCRMGGMTVVCAGGPEPSQLRAIQAFLVHAHRDASCDSFYAFPTQHLSS